MTLGEKLKQARQEKGMSQSQVCGDFITRNMLSQLEHDQASPSLKTLEYLSKILDLPISWMVGEEELVRERQQLKDARARYMAGEYEACMTLLEERATGAQEERLLLCRSALEAGKRAFAQGDAARAMALADQAMEAAASCIYCGPWERLQVGLLRTGCLLALQKPIGPAAGTFLEQYEKLHPEEEKHLMEALLALEQKDLRSAERALAQEPREERLAGSYAFLKGCLLLEQRSIPQALQLLHEAEAQPQFPESLRMVLYERLEYGYKEAEDFRNAYHYASLRLQHT